LLKLLHATSSALLIAIATLLGRSFLDKLLAIKGGPNLIAEWAQVLSLTELFIGPIAAGIGIGLTALISRTDCHISRQDILSEAWKSFRYATLASLACILGVGLFYLHYNTAETYIWPTIGVAIVAGIAGAYLNLINAWWAGKEERHHMLAYSLCSALLICMTAWLATPSELVHSLITTQAVIAMTLLTLSLKKKNMPSKDSSRTNTSQIHQYLFAGMVIGFMSPLSLLIIRQLLEQYGAAGSAGLIQSIWRISEWVATPAVTILSIYFLPKLSASHNLFEQHKKHLKEACQFLLSLSLGLYIIIFIFKTPIQLFLYNNAFDSSAELFGLFLFGDWLRIASWIFLFSFYAKGAISAIIFGEFLSLPLFAALIYINRDQLSPTLIGELYVIAYICYLVFNLLAFTKLRK
jgi:PST family polysaccharide transporter